MKPFDIELAKAGEAVCTRDGRDVRIVCWDMANGNNPIIGLIMDADDTAHEQAFAYNKDGKRGIGTRHDLCMKPKEVKKKTIKEWMVQSEVNKSWFLHIDLCTDEEAERFLCNFRAYKATGREWEVEDEQ